MKQKIFTKLFIFIYKQTCNAFVVNDIITFHGNGMITFYTTKKNGEMDKNECRVSCIVEEEKITLFDSSVNTLLENSINMLMKYSNAIDKHKSKYDKENNFYDKIQTEIDAFLDTFNK